VNQAPARSRQDIENLAFAVREIVGMQQVAFFPILRFAETVLPQIVPNLVFDVQAADFMGDRMGAVDPLSGAFFVRIDCYEGAFANNPRDRFTIAHEVGHALMHVGTLNRTSDRQADKLPAYLDPEWQANFFAGALLMSQHLVVACTSLEEIMHKFGVSRECAAVRAKVLNMYLK
jgi:Zn-dependent peptidase ImmA (M78 family)